MTPRKRYFTLAILVALGLSLLACQLVNNREDRVLTLLYWQAPSIPVSYQSTGTKDVDAGALTLEPLARYAPDGLITPILAEQVPTIENGGVSADLMSITWRLKDGVKWSDGSELTADDVVFTWTYCSDPHTGCTAASAFDDIASVDAVDDLTVKITFDAPTPYPYGAFVGSGVPIISKSQFADCVGASAPGCNQQNFAPLGTGPFNIVSFSANDKVTYERNPEYHGAEPYFDRVEIIGGGDANGTARAVLETGNADYAWNLQIEPHELIALQELGNGRVVTAFSSTVERLFLNQTNPDPSLGETRSEYLGGENAHPFLSLAPVREAMSLAIDRSAISERLYGFAGKPACSTIVGPPNYVSTANDGCVDQDIARAQEILDANGVVDTDGDGIREHQDRPLSVVYQTSTNQVRQTTQEMIQDWWLEIGIETEIVHHDAALFFGGDPVDDAPYSLRRFFADVQMFTGGTGIDPQQYLSGLTCDHIPTRDNNWSLNNITRGCNPAYDELFSELPSTPIGASREELVKRLNDNYIQSYFEIPLVNRGSVSAHLNTLKGVEMNAWDSELWNIAEWYRD